MARMYNKNVEACISRDIKNLFKTENFLDKVIALFPGGIWAGYIITLVSRFGHKIDAVLDNSLAKQETFINGVPVYKPESYIKKQKTSVVIILCCKKALVTEMEQQLVSYGLIRDYNYFIINQYDLKKVKPKLSYFKPILPILDRIKRFTNLLISFRKYKRFVIKQNIDIDNGDRIFINCKKSIGDAYIFSIYFNAYINQNNINKYIYFCLSESIKKTVELFGILNVYIADRKFLSQLTNVYSYLGEKSGIRPVLFDEILYRNRMSKLAISSKTPITMLDVALLDSYNLPICSKKVFPNTASESDSVEQIFTNNELPIGKTVILAPYGGTFEPSIPIEFWIKLAASLKKTGLTVITNCGNDNEIPITGTIGLFIPIKQMNEFADRAGFACSVRTGFCDIISQSLCKLAILYDSATYSIHFFGLKNMGLRDEVLEMYYNTDIETQVRQIMVYFDLN